MAQSVWAQCAVLPRFPGWRLAGVARTLEVSDFVTGATMQWTPSPVQIAIWEAGDHHRRRYVAKPRRIYVSTAFDLEDTVWTLTCDEDGHRVRCAIVLDVEGTDAVKIRERIYQCSSFLRQMGVPHEAHTHRIVLGKSGSEIVCFTAGGDRAGASTGFQRIRYDEFSYYRDPKAITSIAGTASKFADENICTTVDITATNGQQAREYWRSRNGYHKMFFPFEAHTEYRASPEMLALLTDEQWAWAEEQGFTTRSAAAYWLHEVVPNKAGGDLARAMHEFPQREEHMFQVSSGRVIMKTPQVWDVGERMPVLGVDGTRWDVEVRGAWVDDLGNPCPRGHGALVVPENSGQLILGVDTSQAMGKSRSAVVAVDKRDGRIVAAFASSQVYSDDLMRVALAMQERWRSPKFTPLAIIETNGIGRASTQAADRLGLAYDTIEQDDASAEECITEAKRAIEAGQTDGPAELAEECDELHRVERGEKTYYKGRKDLVMAYGLALCRRRTDGYVSPATIKDRERHQRLQEAIATERMGRGGRPPWGA